MAIKKILLVSEYSPGALAWNCSHTLSSLGYQVTQFSCARRTHDSHIISKFEFTTTKLQNFFINQQLLQTVRTTQPDLIFLIKADNITAKTLGQIKKLSSAKLMNWYPDNPFTLWNGNSNAEVLKALPLYDSFAIWSQMLIDPLRSAGCRNVQYAPFGYDAALYEQEITIAESDRKNYASNVCFIGSWDIDRQWWLEQLAHKMPTVDLAIWGNGWHELLPPTSPLRTYLRGNAQYGTTMIKIARCSKIMLNFIRQQNITSHNMRTIEIPASKSFLLTERTHEQAQLLFTEPTTIACFATPDELVEKIQYYLAHPEQRHALTEASYHHVQHYRLGDVLAQLVAGAQSK